MGRDPNEKKKRKDDHIWIPKALLEKPAFWTLSPGATKAYMGFIHMRKLGNPQKGEKFIVKNKDHFIFTYKQADEVCHGMGAQRFRRAIKELSEKGFIDIVKPGKAGTPGKNHDDNGRDGRRPTIYALSERWRLYATKEFDPGKKVRKRKTGAVVCGNRSADAWRVEKLESVSPVSPVSVPPEDEAVSRPLAR